MRKPTCCQRKTDQPLVKGGKDSLFCNFAIKKRDFSVALSSVPHTISSSEDL